MGSAQVNQVNGEKTHSVTLDHITSYPLVADGIHFYKQNPLGAKSISLAHSAYSTFAAPVVPYFHTPYSYVHPYLAKADSLGDDTLSRVDETFPAIKQTDYAALKSNAWDAAYFPFRVAGEGKDYVFNTYDDEYKKVANKGEFRIFTTGKAILSTEIKVTSDALHSLAEWLGPKKDAAKEKLEQYNKAGQEEFHKAKKHAHHHKDAIVNSN